MTITLTPELQQAIGEDARKRGVTAEEVALTALRERFLPEMPFGGTEDNLSEWELEISAAAAQVDAVLTAQRKEPR
jgi:hypothetical protein